MSKATRFSADAVDPGQFFQRLQNRRVVSLRLPIVRAAAAPEHTNAPHAVCLLRARCDRPHDHRTADNCDELSPPHSTLIFDDEIRLADDLAQALWQLLHRNRSADGDGESGSPTEDQTGNNQNLENDRSNPKADADSTATSLTPTSYRGTEIPPGPNIIYAMNRTAAIALPMSKIVCLSTPTSLDQDWFAPIPDQKSSQIRTLAECQDRT
jgi:hypothetical protein